MYSSSIIHSWYVFNFKFPANKDSLPIIGKVILKNKAATKEKKVGSGDNGSVRVPAERLS